MGLYSIKELEQLSGIKAHTIRIWEQRYGILTPSRSESNIRSYNDDELKHLLNVSLLANHGFKISRISKLSHQELKGELLAILQEANIDSLPLGDQINGLIIAMLEMNEIAFAELYNSALLKMDFEHLVLNLFYPFLKKIGIMWGINQANPAQEHFVSNLIRRKMLTEIDKLPLNDKNNSPILLFLKEGELHEIGLLMADYILRKNGHQTIYLGSNVPFKDVLESAKICHARAVLTFFVKPFTNGNMIKYLNSLSEETGIDIFFNTNDEFDHSLLVNSKIAHVPSIPSLLEILSV